MGAPEASSARAVESYVSKRIASLFEVGNGRERLIYLRRAARGKGK